MIELSKKNIAIILLLIFHLVGTVGLCFDVCFSLFQSLSPFNLLLSLFLFVWANNDFKKKFFFLFLIVAFLGYFIEVVGVQTGLLFGEYYYGNTLGLQFFDVPLILGVNWFLLAVSFHGIVSHYSSKKWLIIFVSALLMVALDLLIEPVAMHLDFWQWQGDVVPFQNYFMWGLISAFMQWIICKFDLKFDKSICFGLIVAQVLFFTIQTTQIGNF
jgi:bisanhydrobacterioruberin hydratase